MSTTFDDPDQPATAEELAQAEALAQALEKDSAGTSPELESAALLRQARAVEVSDVLDQVLPKLATSRRRRWWLWPAVLVPAAAGLLVIGGGLSSRRFAEPPTRQVHWQPPTTPWPSAELLSAQSRAVVGGRTALAALEAEMRLYRAEAYRERKRR